MSQLQQHIRVCDAARRLGMRTRALLELLRRRGGPPVVALTQRQQLVDELALIDWLTRHRLDARGLAAIATHARAAAGGDAMPSARRLSAVATPEPRRRRRGASPEARP